MLLRICLIVTILAGAGVIAVSHFKVRPHVQGIIDERETEKGLKTKALAELKTTKENLKTTKEELATTKTQLGETQTQLASAKSQAEAENKRANGLKQELSTSQQALNESQQKLARWNEIPLDPSQVKDVIASEKNLRAGNDVLKEELKIATKENGRLNGVIKDLVGDS